MAGRGRTGLPVMALSGLDLALSGLDLALWDLLGKVQGRPVYDLLGGLRKPKVRAYATGEAFERLVAGSGSFGARDSDPCSQFSATRRAQRLPTPSVPSKPPRRSPAARS